MKYRILMSASARAVFLNCILARLWIASLLWLSASATAFSGDNALEEVTKAWKSRSERIRSGRVKWTTRCRVHESYARKAVWANLKRWEVPGQRTPEQIRESLKDAVREIKPVDGFLEYETRHSYLLDGDKARLEYDTVLQIDETHFAPVNHVWITNGSRLIVLHNSGALYRWPVVTIQDYHSKELLKNELTNSFALCFTLRPGQDPLSRLYAAKHSSHSMVKYGGRECLALHRQTGGDCYLDPAQDYSIVYYGRPASQILNARKVMSEYELSYRKNDADGTWLPKNWTYKHTGEDGKPDRIETSTVFKFETNVEIPASSFEMEFSPGSLVIDQRTVVDELPRDETRSRYLVLKDGNKRYLSPELFFSLLKRDDTLQAIQELTEK